MGLVLWMPCIKDLHNQGLVGTNPTGTCTYEAGKIGNCAKVTSTIDTGLSSDKWDYSTKSISFGGWFKFNKAEMQAAVLNKSTNTNQSFASFNLLGKNSYNGFALSLSTNNIYNPTADLTSLNIQANMRSSTALWACGFGTTEWDTWIHLFITWDFDSKTFTAYKNGAKVDSYTIPNWGGNFTHRGVFNIAEKAVFGGNGPAVIMPFRVNDVRVYDHCLSPKEVKEIAKGLVLHYPLNDAYVEGTVNLGNTSASYSDKTEGYEYTANSWGGDAGTVTYYKSGGYNNLPYKVYHKTASGNGGIYGATKRDISIVAGKTYTMSVWVKASRNFSAIHYSFNINGITSADSNHYITYGKNVPFTTEWTRLSRTFTATELDAGIYTELSIIYDNWDTDYYVYFSGFQIEEKDHATPYTPNTRNETTVYDCSGYQNNGTVEEFKAAGNNLVTSLTAGGQTTVSGETVTTSGVNADTYFSINLSESIVVGQTYTLSCIGKNIPTDGYFGFPLGWQGNTSLMFKIKNGYNEITFTANDGSWGTNRLFMDDMGRDTAYMNQCKFTSFKLYKHSTVNSGLNAVLDSPRYKIGAKFNGQHSIWLSSPLGSGAKEELTVSFWHKPNSQGNYRTIVSNNYPHSGFWIGCNCEGYGLWYYGNGFYVRSQSSLPNDVWYHCALTYKNQTYQWYLNGIPVTTSTSGTFKAPTLSSPISIGGNTGGDMEGGSSDYRQYGALSDFRIYSTALSADDIKELYNTSCIINS